MHSNTRLWLMHYGLHTFIIVDDQVQVYIVEITHL